MTKTVEGQLMLKIYTIYPHLFDVEAFDSVSVKHDLTDYEYTKTIDFNGLFTTYVLKENQPNHVCILWGINDVNDTIIQSLSKLQIPIVLVRATVEQLQDIQCIRFLTTRNYESIETYYDELRANHGLEIIDISYDKELFESKQPIHIIDNRLIDYRLVDVEQLKDVIESDITLHYGFYMKQFIIGPLIINGTTYGYD
ncbi:hypothetical protein J4G37_42425, partial [Microvirga sp. 3-52]|nr:hypothetical protein [Microvirga sp. 3-52]